MKRNFNFNQEVVVLFKEMVYKGVYRGIDNFDKKKPHSVKIPRMNREVQLGDQQVFHNLAQLREQYPQLG